MIRWLEVIERYPDKFLAEMVWTTLREVAMNCTEFADRIEAASKSEVAA